MTTHLVELVAEIDGVDVVAFEVGEHDNLVVQASAKANDGRSACSSDVGGEW